MTVRALLALGLTLAASASTGALGSQSPASSEHRGFDWLGLGGCSVPVIGMPTDFERIAPYIPRHRWRDVVSFGTSDSAQALLVWVLVSCPKNTIETSTQEFHHGPANQMMIGVVFGSGNPEDFGHTQFYLLSDSVDWRRLARQERRIGLPSRFTPELQLDVASVALGQSTFAARMPRGRAPFRIDGSILTLNPVREFDFDSSHFFDGRFGLVRVHHDETWAIGNVAAGTVTAPRRSLVARWMGATQREAQGIYFLDHHLRHVHRYALVD